MKPVSIESEIAWSDFARMQVDHKSAAVFRSADYSWAFNDRTVRKVIAAHIAVIAFARKIPETLDELRALDRVALTVLSHNPDGSRGVEAPKCVGGLAPYYAALIYRAIRLGEDSVELAEELKVTPWGIRQTLYRLNETAKALEAGTFSLQRKRTRPYRRRAGVRRGAPPRWDVQKAIQLREQGFSLEEIGAKLGTPGSTIGSVFQKLGLKFRVRRPRPTAHKFSHTAAIEMRKAGATYQEIAERFGVNNYAAWWACNKGPLAKISRAPGACVLESAAMLG